VRERIQINGQPLSEEQFTKYFFEIWDRLEKAAEAEGQDPKGPGAKPVYFRYLTLMAFHTYLSEGVDAAVIECGIGGAFDSTNVIHNPTVTGITSLGIDHVGVLGSTLPEIAWHKAGIIKPGVKCFTTETQKPEAKAALEEVAQKQKSELIYTTVDPSIQNGSVKIGLQAEFQKINASLAKDIAKEWLSKRSVPTDEETIIKGLEQTRWAGRCETRHEKNITWCIDGGHTLDSIELAGQWFASVIQSQSQQSPSPSTQSQPRILIFNQQTRDASSLARALHSTPNKPNCLLNRPHDTDFSLSIYDLPRLSEFFLNGQLREIRCIGVEGYEVRSEPR
jgi:folylpolyglutamate synthase